MSLTFASIPQKRLLQGITSASSSFYLNNILSWDGETDITPADLGSVHYCCLRNDTGTVVEFMEIDPSTILSGGAITILKRGLSFYGDLTTETTAYKLDWPANSIVMLGTDVPQIFQWLKEYIDGVAIAGAPDASTTVKGVAEEATQAEVNAGTATGGTGARLFVNPSTSTADTSNKGMVEIATDAEIQAGTNTGGTGASLVATPGKIWKGAYVTTTTTSSATPSINTDTYNRLVLSAQAVDITSMSSGLSGTPVDGQKLQVVIKPATRSTAISYVDSQASGDTDGSLTISKPTGTVDGDLMIAVVGRLSGGTYPSSDPAGWTLITRTNASHSWCLYYKIASSEGSNYTWNWGSAVTNFGRIVTFRGGFNASNPINLDCISNTAYQTDNTTVRAATVGVNKQYSPLIFWGIAMSTGYTYTKPTAPTSDWTEHVDSSAPGYVTDEICSMTWSSYGDTGNVDATLSTNTTGKHAFLVALNPEYSITWGTSFTEVGSDLPTTVYGPNPTVVDFQYNSATSKWETVGQDTARVIDRACGATTHDIATLTTTIAHGLGKKPKLVRLKAKYVDTDTMYTADAVYTNGTQAANYVCADTGTGTGEGAGNTFRVGLDASSNYSEGTVRMDSTNIKITWTVTGSPTGTAYINWEAEI